MTPPPDGWRSHWVGLIFDSAELSVYDGDPGHFIREHSGHVTIPCDEDFDDLVKIGAFRAFYVDAIGALNVSIALFDVLDTMSETIGFYDLYDENLCFREAVRKAAKADEIFEPNLLILDRLEIFPAYRGFDYGLRAISGLIHWLQPGTGLVAMKPFPLQFESSARDRAQDRPDPMELKRFKGPFRSARARLRRHYAQLGFRLVPKTDFMVRAGEQPLPELPED